MKGVKGKFMKRLKSIKPIGYLKQDRVLLNAADGYVENFIKNTIFKPREDPKKNAADGKRSFGVQEEPDIIDVAEIMRGLEDEEMEDTEGGAAIDKENISPLINAKRQGERSEAFPISKLETSTRRTSEAPKFPNKTPLSEIDASGFRRPDPNSSTLFDPNLLAAFEQAVKEHVRIAEEERRPWRDAAAAAENLEFDISDEAPLKFRKIDPDPLLEFEEKCPPGGRDSVIFYTTSLRGIRKTFEDCSKVRFLLESFKVVYLERDISMHSEFKEEMWGVLGNRDIPPRLFVKGRYIGGVEEVLKLHEQGRLKPLFKGVEANRAEAPCEGCGGIRFVLCSKCNGSHRIVSPDDGGLSRVNCPQCNENGLVVCSLCCC
ncbi:hypothetical protein SAY87_019287 [Trapa incisa]|uniref:Glutaredoxin domain-containing protein n=1 Tax=Trapa incisa TaxID=236973 RepID=A0AAN7K424_9MYRT|nr:hypothetical protein SAY87_019287 [Trapa incisa]